MSFETFLDGLNKGGFAFLGMVLIAIILLGLVRAGSWLFNKGWPDLMASITKAAETYKETVSQSLAQSEKVMDRQAIMQDNLMASHKEIIGEIRTVVSEVRLLAGKVGEQHDAK